MKWPFPKRTDIVYVSAFLLISLLFINVVTAETTLKEMLQKADDLSIESFDKADEAIKTGSIDLAREALEIAGEATVLFSKVIDEASSVITKVLDEEKKKLFCETTQLALNTHYQISKAITQIIYAVSNIAKTSTSPKTVIEAKKIFSDAQELIQKVEEIKKRAIEILRACGIEPVLPEPYKAPEEELLIPEPEPASPV